MQPFVDRVDSGKQLAHKLTAYKNNPNAIVIGLPRGGVVIAAEIAKELHLPLDIMVPRKIGAPFNEELALGAVTQDGQVVWNEDLMRNLQISPDDLRDIIAKERKESERRLRLYRHGRPPLNLNHKIIILVDDGIATGATMRAAIAYAKQQKAKKIIVAAPIIAFDTAQEFAREVDEVIAAVLPKTFTGISAFYREFPQVSDEQVIALLQTK